MRVVSQLTDCESIGVTLAWLYLRMSKEKKKFNFNWAQIVCSGQIVYQQESLRVQMIR